MVAAEINPGIFSKLVTDCSGGVFDLHPPRLSSQRSLNNLSTESYDFSLDVNELTEEAVYVDSTTWSKLFLDEFSENEERFVYARLFNIKEYQPCHLMESITSSNFPYKDKKAKINHFIVKTLLSPSKKNLSHEDCYIPGTVLRNVFSSFFSSSPFVLSSTKSKIQTEDWRVLLWPAPHIALKEVVAEVVWEENEQEDWNNVHLRVQDYFKNNNTLIRQGQTIKISSNDKDLTINFIYTEPSLQGFLTTQTSIILTLTEEEKLQLSDSYYTSSVSSSSIGSSDLLSNSSININPLQFISTPRRIHKMVSGTSSPLISPTRKTSNTSNASELKSGEARRAAPESIFDTYWPVQSAHTFTALTLENCFLWSQLLPGFKASEIDPHSSIIVPLRALSILRVVSGDWVIAKIPGVDNIPPRWCQIFGVSQKQLSKLDLINKELLGKDFALIDPVLLFNFSQATSDHDISISIAIQKIIGVDSPGIATSVTLARVSSPVANQKSLQNSIASSLKNHLSLTKRVVCLGDIIPVLIDEATSQLFPQLANDSNIDESFSLSLPSAKSLTFFKVTDVLAIPGPNATNEEICAVVQSGLFIDVTSTKTIQQGVEHSSLPRSLRAHYGLTKPRNYDNNSSFEKLKSLIQSCLHPRATNLNIQCSILIYGPRGSGKTDIIKEVADRLGLHLLELYCYEWVEESDAKTQENFSEWFNKTPTYAPCLLLLRNLDGLSKKFQPSDVQQEPWLSTMFAGLMKRLESPEKKLSYPVVIIGTAESIENFPSGIVSSFRHEIQIDAPDEKMRQVILNNLLSGSSLAPDVSISSLATETAALVANDLVDLVGRAGCLALDRLAKFGAESGIASQSLVRAGVTLLGSDFEQALNQSRSQYSDSIGAPKIPNVTWDDVGGLASVKSDILDTIQLPLQHPELFTSGAKKRSGILLYGPPGTGKTLLAKAVATSCALNFFSVKGPELLNMYIGESEANVRRVFQKARDAKPCVIFFDELDSVAPKRGEQGDSGGVMDRIVSQLLAELDGMGDSGSSGEVFVIGATNRPDLLDPALLRPGRFDKMLYLGVSQDHDSQLNIIQALTRKFRLDPQLDLQAFVQQCPFHFTGADFYALCSDAMLKAMSRTANEIELKVEKMNEERAADKSLITVPYYLDHLARPEEIQVLVGNSDFEKALDELTPSVTPSELAHYMEIRQKFSNQTLNGPPSPKKSSIEKPWRWSLAEDISEIKEKGFVDSIIIEESEESLIHESKPSQEEILDYVASSSPILEEIQVLNPQKSNSQNTESIQEIKFDGAATSLSLNENEEEQNENSIPNQDSSAHESKLSQEEETLDYVSSSSPILEEVQVMDPQKSKSQSTESIQENKYDGAATSLSLNENEEEQTENSIPIQDSSFHESKLSQEKEILDYVASSPILEEIQVMDPQKSSSQNTESIQENEFDRATPALSLNENEEEQDESLILNQDSLTNE